VAIRLEEITCGEFKADDVRPDIKWDVIRNSRAA
jgi:DNA-binding transcriptional regulator YdaS (Cro superfamily)